LDESNEVALVRRCQAGDAEAFRALIETYKNVLFGVAYLITRNRTSAEDAVQEGLVKIWKNLPSLRDPVKIKSWLVRIVVNEVKQWFRVNPAPSLPLDAVAGIPCDSDPPEELAMSAERRRLIRRALGALPREQQEAVILRFYSELSVPEIARVIRVPEGTIKSRLSRALSRLGAVLRREGLEAGG